MSGVFGVVVPGQADVSFDSRQVHALAAKMATAMSHREWFVADYFLDDAHRLAIGRIGISIFNKVPQPVWNSDGTIALAMAGEFYNRDELCRSSIQNGQSDEQLALSLYERWGTDFASRLNGAFVIVVWDKACHRLVITNDRFGLYPLFYTSRAGRFIFAPEMKGILCDETFTRSLDLVALAQYMRFQHLLGERTFFEDIKLLPNASVLIYDLPAAKYTLKSYWTFADVPSRPNVNFQEAVEESGRLLRRAVERLSGDAYRPGVFLSGGLDSRTILGLVERRPIVSLTYGRRDCRDVHYASQIARAVNSSHHWCDLANGMWVKELADFHLDLTEGFHSWIHAHGMSVLPQARQLMDVNLTGWDGGTVMGHQDNIEPLQLYPVDEMALATRVFYMFNQKNTWPSIEEAEEGFLYGEPIRNQMRGLAFDSFRAELSGFLHYRPDVRAEYFYIRNHCSRLTHNFVTFTRSHVEVRFPFFDYALFDFLYSLPATIRGHRTLYRALIQRELPRLAYIPYDHDEMLPTSRSLIRNIHALGVKLKHRFNRHMWPIFPQQHTLYADYEDYLRGELREWAENILYSQRTAERGIFNPAFLRTLMRRHLSGLEEWTIGKIAPAITYELMLRKFYD
jgi:asparagine synthase (glutamine-hydrolysing)